MLNQSKFGVEQVADVRTNVQVLVRVYISVILTQCLYKQIWIYLEIPHGYKLGRNK